MTRGWDGGHGASRRGLRMLAADGNVWFTSSANGRIGRITPTGQITTYADPGNVAAPFQITPGPDGNLWFLGYNQIGVPLARVSAINTGTGLITSYEGCCGSGIATGPDGNLWFSSTGNDRIGRISPATGQITTYTDPAGMIDAPTAITAGPDGNLWFLSEANGRIGRITPAGQIITYADPAGQIDEALAITAGPDGNIWFASSGNDGIGRLDLDQHTGPPLAIGDYFLAIVNPFGPPPCDPLRVSAPGLLRNDRDLDGDRLTTSIPATVTVTCPGN